MTGNQTMTALGLGMVGEDQFPEFNELMKAIMLQPLARQLELTLKVGYKEGVVRIWQKMAEYEQVSPLKAAHHKVQIWLYATALCLFLALYGSLLIYKIQQVYGIKLLKTSA